MRATVAEPGAGADDAALVAALRRGDEDAFASLVGDMQRSLLRLARAHVRDRAAAEEVVQETWLGVLTGLDRFEGRSSLRTWIFRILVNRARTRGEREARTRPFSAFAEAADDAGPAVAAERFLDAGDRWAHHWAAPPRSWDEIPDEHLLGREARGRIQQAIDALPPGQRAVITLRDVEGLSSEEACNVLGLSETNQRVLLHRARSAVRRDLATYLTDE
jgi:RNA polymerase sigma-70 factor, ECF subfamily